MVSGNSSDNDFITRLTEIVEKNITNPRFGVSMLAGEMGMSRTNLHRKVNSIVKISVSQFISHARLKKAKEILRHTSKTVSEVAYEVGFNNVSYFIKCFHEYYGYSPGEVENRSEAPDNLDSSRYSKKQIRNIFIVVVSVIVLAVALYIVSEPFQTKNENPEKSIAVLPFTDNSPEEGNEYIINGLRRDIIDKLGKIKKLRVIPGIYADKYRNSELSIKEIAKKLNANYILCGTGQTIESSIKIYLELIDVKSENYQWTKPYVKKLDGKIFDLQNEVAIDVADELKVNITPDEKARIVKEPTENPLASDYYYQGLQKQNTDAKSAVSFFEKAVEEDDKFALAYAELANTYSLLDTGINKGKYINLIDNYADKAILYDNENDKCLITKAKTLIAESNRELAIDYLEKAVEYNPNSAISYRLLVNQTSFWGIADPEKCVEYALKVIKYNQLEEDNILKSMDYRRLARALRQAGLFTEAQSNIEFAINLQPENNQYFTEFCDQIIDNSGNYRYAINLLKEKLANATSDYFLNIYLAKYYYHIRDFQDAYRFYNYLVSYLHDQLDDKELSRLAVIYKHLGMQEKSDSCIERYEDLIKTSNSGTFIKTDRLMRLYCLKKDTANAIKQFRIFNQFKYITFDYFRLFKDEPVYDPLREHPEFQKILSEMEIKISEEKEQIRKSMVAKGLM